MSRTILPAWCLLLVAYAAAADRPPAAEARLLAHRAWVVAEVIRDQHIEPPGRQELLTAGVSGLLFDRARGRLPDDLQQRVAAVRTEEQFAALVESIWPQAVRRDARERALLNAMTRVLPGSGDRAAGEGLLSAQELKLDSQRQGNRYVGIGVQIRTAAKENVCQIVVPFANGPARKAGARHGDLILEIDGKSTQGLNLGTIVERLRGEEGTSLTLTVRQPDASQTRKLRMVRSVVPFDMIAGYRKTAEDGWDYRIDKGLPIAYVRVISVTAGTAHDLRGLEHSLLGAGVRALVLDLRFLPDGDLHHVGQVADALLDSGLLWRVRDARGRLQDYHADRDCLFRDLPVAVVVAKQHASQAAVVLAALLQERRRAIVVGEPLVCDAWVTSLIELPEGLGRLRLRTGVVERLAEPGKRDWCVGPEHAVKLEPKQANDLWDWQHQQAAAKPGVAAQLKRPEDPQLARAVSVLREVLDKQSKPRDRPSP